jgi:hypothetical protein
LSGKSLSIPGIRGKSEFDTAYPRVMAQVGLDEVILQEEITEYEHLTLIWEKDFLFGEWDPRNHSSTYLYWTPLGSSGEDSLLKGLLQFLLPLQYLHADAPLWLLELGLKDGQFYLFQIQPVEQSKVAHVFAEDWVQELISSRLRFSKSPGVMHLLKVEWNARKFRKRDYRNHAPVSSVFQNWEYIFHYFRLFCMINQFQASGESFSLFLSEASSKGFMGTLLKRHLEISNELRIHEDAAPMEVRFQDGGLRFVGKGVGLGVIGQEVKIQRELDLSLIYSDHPPRLIISNSVSLLSHPVLAAAEQGILLILGVPEPLLGDLQVGRSVFFDFEKKILRLE